MSQPCCFTRAGESTVSQLIPSAAPTSFARPSNSGARRATRSGRVCPNYVVLPLASHPALVASLRYAGRRSILRRRRPPGGARPAVRLSPDPDRATRRRERQPVVTGVLAGLADPRLAKALTAMHEAPKKSWTLEDLAGIAGMSRTRFAEHFRTLDRPDAYRLSNGLAHDGCTPASRQGQASQERGAAGRLPERRRLLSRVSAG